MNGKNKAAGGDTKKPAISEMRHLTFSRDALLVALRDYLRKSKQPLPPGVVQSVEIRDKPDVSVIISILDESSGKIVKPEIPPETIGAAMIVYCRQIGIPLPKDSSKSLIASGTDLTLCVHVSAAQTQLFGYAQDEAGGTTSVVPAKNGKAAADTKSRT